MDKHFGIKQMQRWLEREHKVSEAAKFKQEYTVEVKNPSEWYMLEPDKLVVPAHLEESAAKLFSQGFTNWRGVYGSMDEPPGGKRDPVQEAVDQAVRELNG